MSRYVLLVLDDESATVAAMSADAVRRSREHGMAADVVACRSADEVRVRLASGRRYSAVIAGRDHTEIAAAASRAGTPVVVVGVADVDRPPELGGSPGRKDWRARLIAVCGPGGTGTSTVAAALARAWPGTGVLLADCALRSDQAWLHGLAQPARGLLDLVRACRTRAVAGPELRDFTLDAPGFQLLAGLRRPTHWTAVAPRAFDVALAGLGATFEVVVADVTGEFEGERQAGSIDVEERNHMARRVAGLADVVVVVVAGGTGARRLPAVTADLLDLGVDPERIQPVLNRVVPGREPDGVIAVPEAFDDTGPLVGAITARLARLPPPDRRHQVGARPVAVSPGSLGCWPG